MRIRFGLQGWCYALLIVAGASVIACGGGGGGGGNGTADTTPPVIGSIAVSPSLLTVGVQGQIEAEVYDLQSGVQAVLAVVTYPNNKQESIDLQPTGNGAADTTPPVIGSIAVSPSLLTVGAQVQIEAEVYDLQSGVQTVLAVVTYPDNTQEPVALQLAGARYRGAFTAEWTLNSVSQARVVVQATDRAGNPASREQTVQAVAQPPAPPF